MKLKEIKTTGYYVYTHITPTGEFYIGTSQQQPFKRWSPSLYRTTALYEYIQKFGWDNIRHFIFKDGLTREQAYQLEGLLIQEATEKGYCLNKQRSGLIKISDVNAYNRQYNAEHQEEIKQWRDEHKEEYKAYYKQYHKQRNATVEGRIYYRVKNYNRTHTPIETPKEARDKYLTTGYIPSYIKNNDLI